MHTTKNGLNLKFKKPKTTNYFCKNCTIINLAQVLFKQLNINNCFNE